MSSQTNSLRVLPVDRDVVLEQIVVTGGTAGTEITEFPGPQEKLRRDPRSEA